MSLRLRLELFVGAVDDWFREGIVAATVGVSLHSLEILAIEF